MSKQLRIVYMGTPEFAVLPLKSMLENGYQVVAVITAPDKPAGRGRNLRHSPVKEFALEHHLKVLQPLNLKDPDFLKELKELDANLQVVVAFRMLPEIVWTMPEFGTFNLHASLLPQYRGAAPINWVLINGEKETGLTTFMLTYEIDTGQILFRKPLSILDDDDAGTLHDKLAASGSGLIIETLKAISSGNYHLKKQDEFLKEGEILKTAPKIFKEHGQIHWDQPAVVIHNLVRGLSPYPVAYSSLVSPKGEKYNVKVYKTSITADNSDKDVGQIETDSSSFLKIKTRDAALFIHEIQLEGKKRLQISEFLRGFKVDGNWCMM
ncbi:MAG: methionyl-tRNA formyltransferase [Bacteroidales bacterium]|nr:methionyl-tRNA formyltransferase [Bacteroidales bacterium]